MRAKKVEKLDARRAAASERARREVGADRAMPSYREWLGEVAPKLNWDWPHLQLLFPIIDDVIAKRCQRLMVFLPPQHGKSSVITERLPAYILERTPDARILVGAYNQKFANRFSRRNRALASTRILLSDAKKAQDEWETAAGGAYISVGVRGSATGNPADYIIIDDPIKDRASAESETFRESLWEWYKGSIYTRQQPDTPIILIQTRWHTQDLAGMLEAQAEEDGEQWTVVKLPALAEPGDPLGRVEGEALCPERFSTAQLLKKKKTFTEYEWASLYQQRPTPRSGGLFDVRQFEMIDAPPPGLRLFRYWDLAVSQKEKSSRNASIEMGLAPDGRLILCDGIAFRAEWPDAKATIKQIMKDGRSRGVIHGIEAKLHGLPAVQEFWRDKELAGIPFMPMPVTGGDKYTRALAWAARQKEGKVAIVRGDWNQSFLAECENFPNGAFDDQIDSVSGGSQMIGIHCLPAHQSNLDIHGTGGELNE